MRLLRSGWSLAFEVLRERRPDATAPSREPPGPAASAVKTRAPAPERGPRPID